MKNLMFFILMCTAQVEAKTYQNYQLLKATPKTQQQVKELKDMFNDESLGLMLNANINILHMIESAVEFPQVPLVDIILHSRILHRTDKKLDVWFPPTTVNRSTEFLVSPSLLSSVKSRLKSLGIEIVVINHNIQTAIDKENGIPQGQGQYVMSWARNITAKFANYDEIRSLLKHFNKNHSHVSLYKIGSSVENRDMLIIKFSTGPDKKAIFIESGMHGREWLSVASIVKIIKWMASKRGKDSKIDAMMTRYDWVFVPMSNPDGYHYTHTNDRMWRKNRRKITKNCTGTDLNRNFAANWRGVFSSRQPCNNNFRGTSVFSEPESRVLASYVKQLQPIAFFSIHTYSQVILTPFAYNYITPQNHGELTRLADTAATAMEKVDRHRFAVSVASRYINPINGVAFDWAKMRLNTKYSYLIELRPTVGQSYGFIAPKTQIKPSALELLAGLQTFANGFS